VSKLIREWDIDIIHAHHMYAYLSCGMAAKTRGVPCVWHLHESWQPGFLSEILTQAGHLFANHVITIAEYETGTVSRLIRRTGHTLILNAFDFDQLGASQKRAAGDVRAEFGVTSNEILVGYVSHLAPYKGQRTFVHAFARLVDEVPSCRALIVGGPRKSYEWFRDELLEDVRKLGLAERVRFTGVRLDLADIMNALDVFVCVSENQEFNRVLAEAMYFAKPVIASDLRGGSIVAETGRTGILVPPRDPVAMALALARLAKDSELRRKLGANAHEYVLATFPYLKITPMYVDVYDRLLASN